MYFLSSLGAQTAKKTLICRKSGVSADSRKSARSAQNRPFCVKSAQSCESAEAPLFLQINVFAVWSPRLDRKYTTLKRKRSFRKGDVFESACLRRFFCLSALCSSFFTFCFPSPHPLLPESLPFPGPQNSFVSSRKRNFSDRKESKMCKLGAL